MGEDRLLQLPELGRWLEAELFVENPARASIRLECVSLAAAAV
jgi:hypothetical protein